MSDPINSVTNWPHDAIGRTPIADSVKQAIADAFVAVPDDKRGALFVIADPGGPRAMLAAKFGDHWKVAGGVGAAWRGPVSATVAVVGSW